MPQISLDDAHLHYEVAGAADAPPLLLVAGIGGRAGFWAPQVPLLARRFRVITHDHVGVGRSSATRDVRTPAQMADDVVRLMDAQGIPRAHVCGHSTGGSVGQHLAIRHADRVERLVISGAWCGPDELLHATFGLRRQVLESCGPEAYYLLSTLLAAPAEWVRLQFESLAEFVGARMAEFPGVDVELARMAAVIAHDLRGEVHRIAAPTLVLGAADDQLTPPRFQRELSERIPGAHLAVLSYGGHLMPVTNPAEYAQLVEHFLCDDRRELRRGRA